MSLDVYLYLKGARKQREGSGIFVREDGRTKEITREEWDARNPGHEPCIVDVGPEDTYSDEVFSANITHNLNTMADAAGIYQALWRPEEIGIKKAVELAPILRAGLERLVAEPDRFSKLNPSNGWGSYDGLCKFVRAYLAACEQYPNAEVRVWR